MTWEWRNDQIAIVLALESIDLDSMVFSEL